MPGLQYHVYNMSLDTGDVVTNDELRELYHLSKQELNDALAAKVTEHFENMDESIKSFDFYQTQYGKSLAEDNLNNARLYINNDGDLCCVLTMYSLAGADSYDYVYNVTGKTPAKDPDILS